MKRYVGEPALCGVPPVEATRVALSARVQHQKLEMVGYGLRLTQRQLLQRIAQRIPFGMLRLERVLERREPPQRTGSPTNT